MLGFINSNSSSSGGGWIRVISDLIVTDELKGKILITQSDTKIYITYDNLKADQENVITNIGPANITIRSALTEDKLKVNGTICGWCELSPNGTVYVKYEEGYWCIYGVVSGLGSNITANDKYLFNNGLVTGYNWDSGHLYVDSGSTYLRTKSTAQAWIDAGTHTSDQYGYDGTVDSTYLIVNMTGYKHLYIQFATVSGSTFYFRNSASSYSAGKQRIDIDQTKDNSAIKIGLQTSAAQHYTWPVGRDQIWEHGQYQSTTNEMKISRMWLSNTTE